MAAASSSEVLGGGELHASYTRPGVSAQEIREIQECFRRLDTDHDGAITPNDLMEAMNSLGIKWDKKELYQTLAEVDHDSSGSIGIEEFLNLTTALVSEADLDREGAPASNFDALFAKFDAHGDGFITLDKLRMVCRELGETLGSGSDQSDRDLKHMLATAKTSDHPDLVVTRDELFDCLSKNRLKASNQP